MKLLELKIKNITSFRGVHSIDFGQLGDEDLFAITGPTGSGKSSILTAISLALYGKNYKRTLYSNDFVSLGAHDAYSQLKFIVKDKIYTAHWTIKIKKKDGTHLKNAIAKKYIYQDDTILDLTAEDLLNLNFSQFTKTVILNQGEFSRFLTSSFTDRREILEKIYSDNNLQTLGKILAENIKNIQQEINSTELLIDHSLVLSEEELKYCQSKIKHLNILTKDLNQLTKQLDSIQTEYIELQKNIQKSLEISQYTSLKQTEFNDSLNIFSVACTKLNKIEAEYNKLKKSFNINRPKLQDAIKLDLKIDSIKKEAKSFENRIFNNKNLTKAKTNKIKTTINKIHELTDTTNALSKSTQEFSNYHQQLNDIRKLINNLRNKDNELSIIKESHHITSKQALNQKEKINTLADSAIIKKEQFSKWQNEYNLANHKKNKEKYSNLNQQLLELSNNQTKLQNNRHEHKQLVTQLKLYSSELSKLKKQKVSLNNTIKLLDEKKQENQLLQAIILCAKETNSIGKCIICDNSTSKKVKIPLNSDNSTGHEYSQITNQLKNICTEIIHKEHSCSTHKDKIDNLKKSINKLSITLENSITLKKQFSTIEQTIQKNESLKEKIVMLEGTLISLETTIGREKLDYNRSSKVTNNNLSLIDLKNSEINKIKNDIKQSFPRYSIPISSALELLDDDVALLNDLINQKKELDLFTGEHLSISIDLKQLNEEAKELKAESLNNKQQYADLTHQRQNICQFSDPEEELKKSINNLQDKENIFQNLIREIREKERTKEVLQEKIKTLKEDLESLSLYRNRLVHNLKIITITANKDILPTNTLSLYKNFTNGHQKIIQTSLKECSAQDLNIITSFVGDRLTPLLYSIKDESSTQSKSFIEEELKLKNHKAKEKELSTFKKKNKQLKNELDLKQNLFKVIGVSEFRNFVNSFIENKLIIYANQELIKMYDGRYEITTKSSAKGNDFYIIDHFNMARERKVQTLSGGEIFLVSLAMALSLSEMARGQSEIDSFFIDEGFGNLDTDSINEALEVLFKIRSRGKQVGIISHIQDLTDRIPVNITTTKSGYGDSKIKIQFT